MTVIAPALRDPDRDVVLVALEALDAAGGADVVLPVILDEVFRDAAEHAARAHAARAARRTTDGSLSRALDERSSLRAGSSSPCSRCGTANESVKRFGSRITRTDNAARSEWRRSR